MKIHLLLGLYFISFDHTIAWYTFGRLKIAWNYEAAITVDEIFACLIDVLAFTADALDGLDLLAEIKAEKQLSSTIFTTSLYTGVQRWPRPSSEPRLDAIWRGLVMLPGRLSLSPAP